MSDNGTEESAARAPDLEQWPSTTGPVTQAHKIEEALSSGALMDMSKLIEVTGTVGNSAYKSVHRTVNNLVKEVWFPPSHTPRTTLRKFINGAISRMRTK